jgi:hypothetical protein
VGVTDASAYFENAVEGVDESVLVVLEPERHHVGVHPLLLELLLLPNNSLSTHNHNAYFLRHSLMETPRFCMAC